MGTREKEAFHAMTPLLFQTDERSVSCSCMSEAPRAHTKSESPNRIPDSLQARTDRLAQTTEEEMPRWVRGHASFLLAARRPYAKQGFDAPLSSFE